MLVGELEDVLAEAEGPGLDAGVFAQMSLEDAELVRTALGQDAGSEEAEEPDEDDDGFAWLLDHGYGAGAGETDEARQRTPSRRKSHGSRPRSTRHVACRQRSRRISSCSPHLQPR